MPQENSKAANPVVLVVLDGFGVPQSPDSTFFKASRPNLEIIEKYFPFTALQASGVAVGLPWGEEGNSEVGHLTMGAGRPIYHHLPRIIVSIQDGSFFENPAFLKGALQVKRFNSSLHIIGLFSSGSAHSYADHLYALLEFSKRQNLKKVFLHLFTDGRDAPRDEGAKFIKDLETRIDKNYPNVKIASVSGRYFSMDRDLHWDRVEKAYNLMAKGIGSNYEEAGLYVESEYANGRSDEFVEPAILEDKLGATIGLISEGDAVIFYNFREDSVRELARAFVENGFDKFPREKIPNLLFITMTEYEKDLSALVAFPPLDVDWPLARVISERGFKQLHITETEKYAHVTYFFNGGKELAYPGEDRILVQSIPSSHFDEHPEMSASKICETVLENLGRYDFVLVNFANADMVGHTGNFDATVRAIEILDDMVGSIFKKVMELGGTMLVTGDHGNAEEKIYRLTGEKKTKHSINPVPFYLVGEKFRSKMPRSVDEIIKKYDLVGGILTDVAPTILELLGIDKPAQMSGMSLISKLSADIETEKLTKKRNFFKFFL